MTYTAVSRVLLPDTDATASVVTVGSVPPDASKVGKYWLKLIASPNAHATIMALNNEGSLT